MDTPDRAPETPAAAAVDVRGRDLRGRPAAVEVGRTGSHTLLLFLSAGCDGCIPLWELLRRPAAFGLDGITVVAVVDPRSRRQLVTLWRLAGRRGRASAVVAPDAFGAYRAHAPFFVLVAGDRRAVLTEGIAWGADDVARHVSAARRPWSGG